MNTVDLINKVAQTSNLTTGRAEMIISIIAERITDTLKKEGSAVLNGFGEFHLDLRSHFAIHVEPQRKTILLQ